MRGPSLNSNIDLISYQLVVFSNATYSLAGQASFTNRDGTKVIEPITDGGSYVLNGSTLALRFNSPDAKGAGSVSSNIILITVAGDNYVYAR